MFIPTIHGYELGNVLARFVNPCKFCENWLERRREFEARGRAEVGAKGRFVELNFLRTLFSPITCLTNS